MVNKGDLDKIADYILEGKHEKLIGIKSDVSEVQDFLDKVPFYAVCTSHFKIIYTIFSYLFSNKFKSYSYVIRLFFIFYVFR